MNTEAPVCVRWMYLQPSVSSLNRCLDARQPHVRDVRAFSQRDTPRLCGVHTVYGHLMIAVPFEPQFGTCAHWWQRDVINTQSHA